MDEDQSMDNENNDDGIRKLYPDRAEEWGDGGSAVMSYPVWISDRLSVPEETRLRLARVLRAMDDCRKDIQPNGIVHDIIDPSLNARLLNEEELEHVIQQKKKEDKEDEDGESEESSDHEFDTASQSEARYEKKYAHLETLELRGSFQWVPTILRCSFDEKTGQRRAELLGDVAGLPERMSMFEPLYTDLETVLSAMLPLLAKVDLRREGRTAEFNRGYYVHRALSRVQAPHAALQNGELQVVIKAQEYVLPPHSTYTGRWHTEGFSENIVAAGVYYVDVSEHVTGGNLSFRPPDTPDELYFLTNEEDENGEEEDEGGNTMNEEDENENKEGEEEGSVSHGDDSIEEIDEGPAFWQHYIKDVEVQTGTALVFHNTIPHRFRGIRNDTDEPQHRIFVNFFFVDPDKPLKVTTSNTAGSNLIRRALARAGIMEEAHQTKILDFVGGYGCPDFLHRKVLRDQARAAMSKDRPHWYTMNFGNSGHVLYHGDYRVVFSDARSIRNYGAREHSSCPTSGLGSGM